LVEECLINDITYKLVTTHPSPFSAENKTNYKKEGYFIGSNIFIKINQLLEKLKKKEINWLSILGHDSFKNVH
jgi:uracil DNA glycosylase